MLDSVNVKAGESIKFFVPITRIDKSRRMVYGYGVTDQPPRSGRKRITVEAMEKALPEWMKYRNIREMHQLSAVGKAQEVEMRENGIWLGSKIVDDEAWRKCEEGVYIGYSVGGKEIKSTGNDVVDMQIREFSLVDSPDIENCQFHELVRSGEPLTVLARGGIVNDEDLKKAHENFRAEVARASEAEGTELSYSLWFAQQLIGVTDAVLNIRSMSQAEAVRDKTGDAIPIAMDAIVDLLARLMVVVTTSEAGKLVAPTDEEIVSASAPENLARAGATLSESTIERLRSLHGTVSGLLRLGVDVEPDPEKADAVRAVEATPDAEAEAKSDDVLARLRDENTELRAKIETVVRDLGDLKRAVVVPGKTRRNGTGTVVEKADDIKNPLIDLKRGYEDAAAKGDTQTMIRILQSGIKL